MRVVLDARQTAFSGIGRYALQLARAMTAVAPELDLVLLSLAPSGMSLPGVREVVVPVPYGSAATMLWHHRTIERLHPDLVHVAHATAPLFLHVPFIVTVHDLMDGRASRLLYRAPLQRALASLVMRRWVRSSVGRAAAVLTPSHVTAADLRVSYPSIAVRVEVTHLGVEPRFRRLAPPPARPARRFVLAYGNGRPYKNLRRLVEAFARVAPDLPDVDLVILARRGPDCGLDPAALDRPGLAGRIRLEPPVSDDELVLKLNQADALAFPSLCEGFGLPVAEAMACGCPVVTSAGTACAEVAGDAAELVDPCDVDSIAAGLRRVLRDRGRSDELRCLGLSRARELTWEACARRTVALYRRVLGGELLGSLSPVEVGG